MAHSARLQGGRPVPEHRFRAHALGHTWPPSLLRWPHLLIFPRYVHHPPEARAVAVSTPPCGPFRLHQKLLRLSAGWGRIVKGAIAALRYKAQTTTVLNSSTRVRQPKALHSDGFLMGVEAIRRRAAGARGLLSGP